MINSLVSGGMIDRTLVVYFGTAREAPTAAQLSLPVPAGRARKCLLSMVCWPW